MEYSSVKALIGKYFSAETSLEEEMALKEYFQKTGVHPDFEKYRPLFLPIFEDGTAELGDDFDQKMIKKMQSQGGTTAVPIKRKFPHWVKIAAILLMVLGSAVLIYTTQFRPDVGSPPIAESAKPSQILINDTYTDPEQARQQLEKALAFLSSKMNKGSEVASEQASRLQVISKIIETTN